MRLIPAKERAAETERSRRLPPVKARKLPQMSLRERMIDLARTPTIHMVCGHTTDYDVQLRHSHARPKSGKLYCEICGRWVHEKKRPKPPPLPDEPMF